MEQGHTDLIAEYGGLTMKEPEGSSLRDILNALFRRSYILKIIVVLLPLGTLVATYLVDPVYETSAKIMVTAKQENANLLFAPNAPGSTSILTLNVDESDLNSEMELLVSPDLWIRTVEKLGLRFFEKPEKEGLGKWLRGVTKTISETLGMQDKDRPQRAPRAGEQVEKTARTLRADFSVVPVVKSRILDVKFKYDDPVKAEKILTTHLDVYIPYHAEVYSTPGAQKLFSGQEDAFRQKMVETEERLQGFKTKWDITAPQKQKEEILAQIKGIQDTLVEIRADVTQYENMLSSLRKGEIPTGQLSETMGRSKENTVISVIAAQLLQALQKRLEISIKFSSDSPDYMAAEELVTNLQRRFTDTLVIQVENLHVKQASLEKSLREKQEYLEVLDRRAQELTRLELEATIAKERYVKYAGREDDARLEGLLRGQQLSNVKVVSRPSIPITPVFPKRGLFVLGAFLLAFPLGLGLIMVTNFFDSTFFSPQQVEAVTGYKVLASFRKLEHKQLG